MGQAVLVIGAGIAGIQASLDLADRGLKVYLVEKTPSIGGRMSQLDKTFPTLDCSICIEGPKMVEAGRHHNIELLTYSEVKKTSGFVGNFKVEVLKKSRYVERAKCTGCGDCAKACPVEVPNEYDVNLGPRKAIYIPLLQAVPNTYTIDMRHCIKCFKCVEACGDRMAIDFSMQDELVELSVGAVIVSTGFDLFDPSEIGEYGYGRHKNVITAMELERLICASGPTRGLLERPSDKKHPKRIAFIQCVGSRDVHRGYAYCSAVCCMFATKEAIILKEHDPEVEVYIFYNELKIFGKGFQEFVTRARDERGVKYFRTRPGEVVEDPKTSDLALCYEDTTVKMTKRIRVDLVVLCPALFPSAASKELAGILGLELDEYGFFKSKDFLFTPVDTSVPGIFICGYCQGAKDIPDSVAQASGAAARAAEVIAQGGVLK